MTSNYYAFRLQHLRAQKKILDAWIDNNPGSMAAGLTITLQVGKDGPKVTFESGFGQPELPVLLKVQILLADSIDQTERECRREVNEISTILKEPSSQFLLTSQTNPLHNPTSTEGTNS